MRRAVVLAIALLLVFGIGKLVGTGSDDSGSAIEASTSSATDRASSQPPSPTVTMGPVAPAKKLRAKAKVPLAMPSGECRDDEINVLPSVPRAWAGGPIEVRLQLTGTEPACTFEVSSESIVVKVTSGDDRIWSSQDCPKVVEKSSVVVRSGQPVEASVTWNGRRSDEDCTPQLDWAMPGFYHVHAAVLGSSPTDVQFEVTRGPAVVKTRTPKPRPGESADPAPGQDDPSPASAGEPSASPAAEPSRRP
jgi:hypothetical protein